MRLGRWRRRSAGALAAAAGQTTPASRAFGFDRGLPIDRYYIEKFLTARADDICGRILEVGDNAYTRKFGRDVIASEVLHKVSGSAAATLVGDLETGEGIPTGVFSCLLLTQTFPFIYDVRRAVATCHLALAPGGVLLSTFPGISQISRFDMDRWGDYWRFTDASVARLCAAPGWSAEVTTYGNVASACALLYGLAAHELTPEQRDLCDPDYQVTIALRAVKPA
jgi:hypothetical protein